MKEENKQPVNWKTAAIAALAVALLAIITAIVFSQRTSRYFGVETGDDGVVTVIASNASDRSSGIGTITVGNAQQITVRSGMTDGSSISVKIRSGSDPNFNPLVEDTFKGIDVRYYMLPEGEYSILVEAAGGATGNVTFEPTASSITPAEEPAETAEQETPAGDPLSLWTDEAPAKAELTAYIEAVTDEKNPDYIPPERRIAVFDLDGTLFCETDPNYFDYTLLVHRVLEDEDYKDKASDFEKETAEKIVTLNETGVAAKGLEVDHGKAVASAFSGMTLEEFNDYIQEFKKLEMPGYDGMLRGEGFYKPMVEVVEYLQANDFTVYIVSGTDRFIVRGICYESELDVPNSQIIGSDETLVTKEQGDVDGLNYVFTDSDELVLGGEFIIKNLKMNKVTVIAQEIGQQPVLSFGNSTGDSSMAEYATSNNPYRSLAFMLCCDDTERENGNVEKADKMYALCEEYDWVPISMKNDWTTIYGEGVTRK
ncbi:MAG: haloacid dehalogenase-like hydrolase [Solobacterium sp.]|nr:haloacid dehalogenase-like hydrolase [Solobacterium sp.]